MTDTDEKRYRVLAAAEENLAGWTAYRDAIRVLLAERDQMRGIKPTKVLAGVEYLLHHSGYVFVQYARSLKNPREQSLQPMSEFLDGTQIHRAGGPFEAVRPAEHLLQACPLRRRLRLRDDRQKGTDLLHVIAVFHLERRKELLLNILQVARSS